MGDTQTPMYQIIMNDLKGKIAACTFKYDEPLCTEKSLCESYGVSRITAKRAIDELEQAGLLYRKRGVGSFVRPDADSGTGSGFTGSTMRAVSLLIPFSLSRGGIFATIESASSALASAGIYLTFHVYTPGLQSETDMLLNLYQNGVDGVIYYPSSGILPTDVLDLFAKDNKPVVIIDKPNAFPQYSSVICDNFAGSYAVTAHVLGYGHRNTCYLSRYTGEDLSSIRERYSGYRRALLDADIDSPRFVQVEAFNDTTSLDYPMLKHVVNTLHNEGVTAIICENDEVAFYVHMSCRSLSLRLGEDISITGFDNIHWATTGSARITTAEQDFRAIGEEVARIILQPVYQPVQTLIPVKLIPRTSTGPVPTEREH